MRPGCVVALLCLVTACGPRTSTPEAGGGTSGGKTATTSHARTAACALAPAGCHNVEECHSRGICEPALPSSDPGCGIPPHHEDACQADPDCKAGEVCNPFASGCTVGKRCEARCDTAGCPDGSLCRPDGRCSARHCPDEWSCGDYGDCKPPASGEGPLQGGRDWHGCVPFACTSDADCPCAHCVSGHCSAIPGRCIEPRG